MITQAQHISFSVSVYLALKESQILCIVVYVTMELIKLFKGLQVWLSIECSQPERRMDGCTACFVDGQSRWLDSVRSSENLQSVLCRYRNAKTSVEVSLLAYARHSLKYSLLHVMTRVSDRRDLT